MKLHRTWSRIVGLSVVAFSLLVSSDALADDWPAFRGAHGDGISRATSVFPSSGEFALEVAWKKKIGSGYAGVAVAEGIAVTAFSDGTKDVLAAFDSKTGTERWRFEIEDMYVGHDGSHTGPIATPTIAGGRVYGLGARGRFFALNAKDGSLIWSTNLKDDHEASTPFYGFSTSPFVRGGVVIVLGGAKEAAIAGFDAKTGKLLWKAGEDEIGYQSPIDYELNGVSFMLAPGSKKLFAFAPKTGEIVWEFEHKGTGATGSGSLSPVPARSGNIFLSNKKSGSTMFAVSGSGDSFKATSEWESKSIRNSYNVPVYHDGYIYAYSSRFLTCVDAKTGDAVWRSRDPGDGFVVIVDGHLVIVTKKTGEVHVAKASPLGFTSLASVSVLDDVAWAHPSFAEGAIFVRSMDGIARVDIRRGAARAESAVAWGDGNSRFGKFLSKVNRSSDKKGVVDSFLARVKEYPLIEGESVHFLYRGKGSDVAVGSDLFGARQERKMQRVAGTNLFYYSAKLERNARVNYVFVRDYEDHFVDPRNNRQTKSSVYGKEMEMNFGGEAFNMSWFSMPDWKAPTFFATPDANRKGRIDSREIESKLIEKDNKIGLDVYLPYGYEVMKSIIPVAYVWGGEQAMELGEMPRALDNIIRRSVAPVIVVFIKTKGRIPADKQAQIFAKEIIPYIDKSFHTAKRRESRACIGAGFDGFTAMSNAFANSDLIGKVATMSMFMFGSMEEGLKPNIKTAKAQPIELFMQWGKYDPRSPDEAWDLSQTNRDFVTYLRKRGFEPKGGEINEGTGWSTWKNRTEVMFAALFPMG